jgi:hypothetical protein
VAGSLTGAGGSVCISRIKFTEPSPSNRPGDWSILRTPMSEMKRMFTDWVCILLMSSVLEVILHSKYITGY